MGTPENTPNPNPDELERLTDEDLAKLQPIIQSYVQEFELGQSKDLAKKCEAILSDNLEAIMEGMADIALNEPDVRVRFQAQKYIADNLVFPRTGREGGREEFAGLLERISTGE